MSDSGRVAAVSHLRSPNEPEISSPERADTSAPEGRDLAAALHEVSNALTVVLGWLEEAREASMGNARAERAIDIALSRALVGRNLARQAIGADVTSCPEESSLGSLVRDSARGIEREAARKGVAVSVRMQGGADGASVRDASAALQILTNLLLNAIAMGSQAVVIEAALVSDEAKVSVIDDGPGIEPSRREIIFDGVPSSRPGGAGLGLRHARAMARDKGGELAVLPTEMGAHFELTWPLAPPRSGVVRPLETSRGSLVGMRVAILDDDEVVLDLLTTALEVREASVLAVRTAAELESSIGRERIDVALLDLSPLSGALVPLLHRLREANPDGKVVLISGSAGALPSEAEEHFFAWVRKPFELGEVLTVLEEIARGRNCR